MEKKGFTLIELLAVIVILAVIALIATPLIMNVINDAKKNSYKDSAYGIIEAARIKAFNNTKKTAYDVNNSDLEYTGDHGTNIGNIVVDVDGHIAIEMHNDNYCIKKDYSEEQVMVTDYNPLEDACDGSGLLVVIPDYQEEILNGADPVLSNGLIPVMLDDDGTVRKVSPKTNWYEYGNKKWANAVILKGADTYQTGEVIDSEDIKAYFVWIPKYSYQLFDLGTYTTYTVEHGADHPQEIQIMFGTENTSNDIAGECTTPMTSGTTGECQVGDYMTHPAFKSLNVNGIWVGKFETTGSTDNVTVLPSEISLRDQTVSGFYNLGLNFLNGARSHMMKNTEWGAVAYLSHSIYGINREVRVNNNSYPKTGYSAQPTTNQSIFPGEYGFIDTFTLPYNTTVGYQASTTGNITGVYDMAGASDEAMASFMKENYNTSVSGIDASMVSAHPEYFDVYEIGEELNTSRRILGDATAEMGPFYFYTNEDGNGRIHNSWYGDTAHFLNSWNPWLKRGGFASDGVLAGQFQFYLTTGQALGNIGFRLVLAPIGE